MFHYSSVVMYQQMKNNLRNQRKHPNSVSANDMYECLFQYTDYNIFKKEIIWWQYQALVKQDPEIMEEQIRARPNSYPDLHWKLSLFQNYSIQKV